MLKLATWNVNSVKARLERLKAFLARHQPDIVCLQELKGTEDLFPFEELRQLGYSAAVHGQKTYNGVAVLAKETPRIIARGFDDAGDDSAARFLCVEAMGIRVASCYIPNGQEVGSPKFDYKLEWLRRLRQYLDRRHSADEPLVLAGDFNVAPEDRDVYDPQAWRGQILFSDAEKNALADVKAFGLQDTLRALHPESGLYSWWDYRQLGFPKNRGLRIDFVLATAPLAERCRAAWIDRDERRGNLPSDHAPVFAEFELVK